MAHGEESDPREENWPRYLGLDRVTLKGSEKVGCAFIPSQIILTHKFHEFDDIVKETHHHGA
jgi:hypothetical protein